MCNASRRAHMQQCEIDGEAEMATKRPNCISRISCKHTKRNWQTKWRKKNAQHYNICWSTDEEKVKYLTIKQWIRTSNIGAQQMRTRRARDEDKAKPFSTATAKKRKKRKINQSYSLLLSATAHQNNNNNNHDIETRRARKKHTHTTERKIRTYLQEARRKERSRVLQTHI